jgi:hypothetical protein
MAKKVIPINKAAAKPAAAANTSPGRRSPLNGRKSITAEGEVKY